VWASGEIDLLAGDQLRAALETTKLLIVDLSELTFLDVGNLRHLVEATQRTTVTIIPSTSPRVWRLLELTDTTHLFENPPRV
jgi:anti-anti-sigma regulatory factor